MNAPSLIDTIDAHLEEDEKQLAHVLHQHDDVRAEFTRLMARLRGEIEAGSGGSCGHAGALHFRG